MIYGNYNDTLGQHLLLNVFLSLCFTFAIFYDAKMIYSMLLNAFTYLVIRLV